MAWLYVVGIFAIIVAANVGRSLLVIKSITWRPRSRPSDDLENQKLPINQFLESFDTEFERLGFRAVKTVFEWPPQDLFSEKLPARLYVNPAQNSFAYLGPHNAPERGSFYRVRFWSKLGATFVVTFGGDLDDFPLSSLPGFILSNAPIGDLTSIWKHHLALQKDEHYQPFDYSEFDQKLQSITSLSLAEGEKTKVFEKVMKKNQEFWQFTWRGAYRFLLQQMRAQKQRQLAQKNVNTIHPEFFNLEAWAFQYSRPLRELSVWTRFRPLFYFTWISLGALSIWSFAGPNKSFYLPAIILVILVHETGHWLAMKIFNYKEPKIFLIPFFGGIASGQKEKPHPKEELIVLLAGPLFGLFAAAIAYQAQGTPIPGSAQFLNSFIMLSVYINFLNLLPIHPLDGGKILDLLILSRVWWLRLVFTGVSALLFLMIGTAANDGISKAIGIGLIIGLGQQLQVSRLNRLLKVQIAGPESELTKEVFRHLSSLQNYLKLRSAQRTQLVTEVVKHHLSIKPRFGLVFGGMTALIMSLFLGLFGIYQVSKPSVNPKLLAAKNDPVKVMAVLCAQETLKNEDELNPYPEGRINQWLTCAKLQPPEQRAVYLQKAKTWAEQTTDMSYWNLLIGIGEIQIGLPLPPEQIAVQMRVLKNKALESNDLKYQVLRTRLAFEFQRYGDLTQARELVLKNVAELSQRIGKSNSPEPTGDSLDSLSASLPQELWIAYMAMAWLDLDAGNSEAVEKILGYFPNNSWTHYQVQAEHMILLEAWNLEKKGDPVGAWNKISQFTKAQSEYSQLLLPDLYYFASRSSAQEISELKDQILKVESDLKANEKNIKAARSLASIYSAELSFDRYRQQKLKEFLKSAGHSEDLAYPLTSVSSFLQEN